jgi:Ca2+-binding EF-hand superfamily protein
MGHGEMGAAKMMERFDAIDADKDGKVTEAEIAAFRAARFTAADLDKNGSLSAEELSAMQMAEMQTRMGQRASKMIERLDGNADGQLSAEEFAEMGQKKSPFERADADGDGAVSKAEVEAMIQKMADRGGKHGKHGRGHGMGHGWMDAN